MYICELLLQVKTDSYLVESPDFNLDFCFIGNRDEAIEALAAELKTTLQNTLLKGEELPKRQKVRAAKKNEDVITLALDIELPPEGLVTLDQAAQILGVSRARVSYLVRKGRLEAVDGKRRFVTRESVSEFAKTPRKAGRPITYAYVNLEQEET